MNVQRLQSLTNIQAKTCPAMNPLFLAYLHFNEDSIISL